MYRCPCGATHSAEEWNENSREYWGHLTERIESVDDSNVFYCSECKEVERYYYNETNNEQYIVFVGEMQEELNKGDEVLIIDKEHRYKGAIATVVVSSQTRLVDIEFFDNNSLVKLTINKNKLKKVGE